MIVSPSQRGFNTRLFERAHSELFSRDWQPASEQQRDWNEKGYFIVRDVVLRISRDARSLKTSFSLPSQTRARMRSDGRRGYARCARRAFASSIAFVASRSWNAVYVGAMAPLARRSRQLLVAAYLSNRRARVQPRLGIRTADFGATARQARWMRMALDPAMRENGCLQFIPSSHRTEIVSTSSTRTAFTASCRARVRDMINHGVEHIEKTGRRGVLARVAVHCPVNESARAQ